LYLWIIVYNIDDMIMRKFFSIILFCVLSLAGYAQVTPDMYLKADKQKMNHWVDSVYNSMTDDERIGQLFMIIADLGTSQSNVQMLTRYVRELKIGGVLWHKGTPDVQAKMTNDLQSKARIPLFIALDGEWGLSMRLSGTTRFPRNMMLGAIEDNELIRMYGEEVARQCKEMGIQINFAPSVDVNSNTDNPVIGTRSFGENPKAVAEKGIAYAKGLESRGIISVAKHFPGHGDTSEDSHHTLPVLRHDIKRLEEVELVPFKEFINAGLAGVMTAHLYIPSLERSPRRAVSLSPVVVSSLLQEQLQFTGLCFTDALAMKGATADKNENPSVQALLAGNDVLLAPANPTTDFRAVKNAVANGILDMQIINEKCKKILSYKYITGLNEYKPIELKGLSDRLNSSHAQWLVSRLNAEAITLLKNEDDFIPVKQIDKKKIAVLSIGEDVGNSFQSALGKYTSMDRFSILLNSTPEHINRVYSRLANYDVIICSVHTVRIPQHASLLKLATEKELVFSFFTIPYFCTDYKTSIMKANSVVLAYENTIAAQKFAAQLIFGGIEAKGKLSVSIPELYFSGEGIFTQKTRLSYHEPEEVGLDPDTLKQIDRIVNAGLTAKAYPGCQVLVAKDGVVVYDKSFGNLDFENNAKVTESTMYDIASMSKAVGTLMTVMKAYDEKKISLNGKLQDYLPFFKGSDKEGISIEEMLYHESGLSPIINFYLKAIDKNSYKGSLYSSKKAASHPIQFDRTTYVNNDFKFLPKIVSTTPNTGFSIEVAKDLYIHDSFNDSVKVAIKDSRLRSKEYRYSCVNFILLKMIAEEQLKKSMDEFLESSIYGPIGMQNTMYNPLRKKEKSQVAPTENDRFLRNQLIRGYVHDEAAAFQGGVSGNAGLFSTTNDIAKVSQMLLNNGDYGGERFLSEATVKLFTQSKTPNSRRGLGFDKPLTTDLKRSPCGELAPPSVYGHTGFTGTCFWIDPDNNLVYVFLCNQINPTRVNSELSRLNIRTRIHDTIYKSFVATM